MKEELPYQVQCPGCFHIVKPLPDKPTMSWSATTADVLTTEDSSFVLTPQVPTKEVYKCVNEKCWVTRIELDWGQS